MKDERTTPSCSAFLSSEERFDVWSVKKAERPELLERDSDADEEEMVFTEQGLPIVPLPLTDGCDLRGWRGKKVVHLHENTLSVLNVGYSCPLLRRESQLPMASNKAFQQWHTMRRRLLEPPCSSSVTRIDCETTPLALHPWFERDNVPVVLDGCTQHWRAMDTCTFERLLLSSFGELHWRFSDTHSETMTLQTYAHYLNLEGTYDDAPLAVYDSQFADDERSRLLDDYSVPACFDADLFNLLPDGNRPPFRWILIGPARSGTGLHIDPAGTHAWVTLIQGCKRWVLFPYGTDLASIEMREPQIPSVIWFRDYYDQVIRKHPHAIEILQHPGETVYVPAGWPHLVLNLDESVAITHNYASEYPSMNRLWQALSDAEPSMAHTFYTRLEQHRPDLVEEISK